MAISKEEIVTVLCTSYRMEIETVINYLANSINPEGVRAEEIKKALAANIAGEILHAQQLGKRIKQLGGVLPGSAEVKVGSQEKPLADTTDVISVIEAVIGAEDGVADECKCLFVAAHQDCQLF